MDDEMRVLVVDDQADFADSIAQVLRSHGYTVRTASDGLEALALIDEFNPVCLLLDLSMPNMSGQELARTVRAREGHSIVLVAVSGIPNLHIRSPEVASVDHWLAKPIDFNAFHKIFRKIEP